MSKPPLADLRILDFSALLPGAVCSLWLADLGAEVIKIEPPVHGEAARGPAGTPPGGLFHLTNRNKKSLALDLKEAAAIATLHQLVESADAVLESFRPGVMARLGLDYPTLRAINPRLVYCSLTGYGQSGPLAARAGHDINYQAVAGVLGQNVVDGSRPSPGSTPLADMAGGGLSAAVAMLAALFDAQRSGIGRHIDIAMADCTMALNLMPLAGQMLRGGQAPVPGCDLLSGGLPCYRTYATADGRHLAVGALEHKFWRAFCQAIGRPDLEPRGWDMGEQLAATVAEIAATIASKTLAEWQAILADIDACATPVPSLAEALAHPQAQARAMVIEVAGGGATTTQYALPIRMSDFAFAVQLPPPHIGQHNGEILAALAALAGPASHT